MKIVTNVLPNDTYLDQNRVYMTHQVQKVG